MPKDLHGLTSFRLIIGQSKRHTTVLSLSLPIPAQQSLFLFGKIIQAAYGLRAGLDIATLSSGDERLFEVRINVLPARQADTAQILGLKAQISATQAGRVDRNEQTGNTGAQDRL